MTRRDLAGAVATTSMLLLSGAPAAASECPKLIQEAEALLQAAKRAGAALTAPEYVSQAVKLIDEAKARHADGQGHEDHHAAATKGRVAKVVAQLAIGMSQ